MILIMIRRRELQRVEPWGLGSNHVVLFKTPVSSLFGGVGSNPTAATNVMGSRVVGAVKSTRITFILLSGTHLRYNR